ncbi:LysE family translocator [Vibrio methylphosphonaticus]|uniref:LysE family translocator n=1 Tax=Vibrio methylphosphonaticus TaxID=2946866 RepID=UPI00202AA6AF|nr:LysE family translocator [Vibrio methylphosphonaticus]MCL9777542.1 LysE family translocator [Vibrio methylphosphonaticus]
MPAWFLVMKCVGGLYLIYLGIKSFRQTKKMGFTLTGDESIKPQKSSSSLFKEAFFVSASNPKTMVLLSAFLPQFLDTTHPHTEQFTIMYLSICAIVVGVHLTYVLAINFISRKLKARDFESKLDKITGGLFISMGGWGLVKFKGLNITSASSRFVTLGGYCVNFVCVIKV